MPLPFDIVSETGHWAQAEDEGGALLAARTLRADLRAAWPTTPPTIHILYEGNHVLTITKEMKP